MTRVVTKLKLFSQKKYTGYSLMMVKNLRDDREHIKAAFGLSSKMIIFDVVVIKTIFKPEH